MNSLIRRFYSSTASVRTVILTADTLFLLCLLASSYLWWVVRADVSWGRYGFVFKWRDTYLWLPAFLLLIHGIAAYGAQGLDRAHRLGLFRYRIIPRLVLLYVAIMTPLKVADHFLKRTKLDIQLAPMVLVSRDQGVEHFHRDLLKDPDLVWRFEPGSTVYGGKINSLGFRDREVNPQKAEGVRRVICLGDSMTAQGQPGYARYLHDMLTNAPPDGGKWEAFSMGVYGYSSLQGLRVLELQAKDLKPDIVTVSFGRNDHVYETPDRVRMGTRLPPFLKGLYTLLSQRTVGRLMLLAVDRKHQWTAMLTKGMAPEERNEDRVIRVPAEDFRNAMRQFVKEIRGLGATPILVTAPRRKIPPSYVDNGVARSQEEFQRHHDEYAQIVRDVAKETGAPLLDLQRLMEGSEFDRCFANDAIHLDFYDSEGDIPLYSREQPGLRFVARSMYDTIRNLYATAGLK